MYWWATKRVKRFEIESQQSDVNKDSEQAALCCVKLFYHITCGDTICKPSYSLSEHIYKSNESEKNFFAKQTHFKVK